MNDRINRRYSICYRLRLPAKFVPLFLVCALATSCVTDKAEPPPTDKPEAREILLNQDGEYYAKTARYTIDLRVPRTANEAATKHLRDFAKKKADALIELTRDEPAPGYFDEHQYQLNIDWEAAESDEIYTFILRGNTYTGGAHHQHFLKTFSYKKADDFPVALSEILATPQSLEQFSRLAAEYFREQLGNQLDVSGLAPKMSNWENWLVSNASLTFLFPPYQIAPFAAGEQSFTVYVDNQSQDLFNTDLFAATNSPRIEIWDKDGHGPDPGSEEAARAAAWQFIQQSESYDNDGFGLEITNLRKLDSQPPIYIAEYSWRHYGDLASLYTGEVRIEDDTPRFINNSQNIVGPAEILMAAIQAARTVDEGEKEIPATPNGQTPIADLLVTEHQFMTVYGQLQQRYGISRQTADKLWQELSQLETFEDWVNRIAMSKHLVD